MAGILLLLLGRSLCDRYRIESETASAACDSSHATGIAIYRGRRILAGAVLLLGTGLAGACAPSVTRKSPSREADVYAVWGAMVDGLRGGRQDRRLPVLLDTLATSAGPGIVEAPYDAEWRSLRGLFGVTDEMISAFASPDSAPARIAPALLARYTRVHVVSGTAGVPNLELRRDGRVGTVHLSLVAFNATRTLALVQGSWVCGGLCGHASTAVMEKDASGRWRTKTTLMNMVF